jgi:hypothetical protein
MRMHPARIPCRCHMSGEWAWHAIEPDPLLVCTQHSASRTASSVGLRHPPRIIPTSPERKPAAPPVRVRVPALARQHRHACTTHALASTRARPCTHMPPAPPTSMRADTPLAAGRMGSFPPHAQYAEISSACTISVALFCAPLDRCVERAGEPARANGLQCKPCPQLQARPTLLILHRSPLCEHALVGRVL